MIIDNESLWAIVGTIFGIYIGWFFTYKHYNGGIKPFWKRHTSKQGSRKK